MRIHNKFVEYFKKVDCIDRMRNRNGGDDRLSMVKIYTEKHHIIPRHSSGSDDIDNIIELLPEEHVFLHHLRWKALGERGDILAVRFCLNGRKSVIRMGESFYSISLNKKNLKQYALLKQECYNVRSTVGWQSSEGRKMISESRRGMVPVIDSMGNTFSVLNTDSRFTSGELVHVTKGRKVPESERKWRSINATGSSNNQAIKLSKEEILEYCLMATLEIGRIVKVLDIKKHLKEFHDINIPSTGLGYREDKPAKYVINWLKEQTGWDYNPLERSPEMREKISKTLKEKEC